MQRLTLSERLRDLVGAVDGCVGLSSRSLDALWAYVEGYLDAQNDHTDAVVNGTHGPFLFPAR